jgi:antitoxin ParD1/3/4
MPPARTVTIGLSEDQARWIDDRVGAGEYASEREVVSAGLEMLQSQLGAADLDEDWVRRDVIPRLERMRADPSLGFSVDDVRKHLASRRAGTIKEA